jgi:phenylacetate-CoA ligase
MLASQLAAGFRPWDRFTTLGRDIHLPVHFYHRLGLYRRNVIPIRLPIELQIQRLREFQPTIINTWPSALRALMHHFKYPLRDLVNPKLIFCSSEVFDDILRERLENELDAELLNLYAAHECAQIALECPAHEGLHLQADQVILESLDNGEQVGFGHQGVAVITSLYSFAMPFIRYSLGDLVVLSDKKCSCGSSFPLMGHPIGRVNDLAKLPSGKVVSPQGFSQILQGFKGIEQWRMIQETESHFVLKLVMRHETGGEFLRSLLDQFLEYLGETVRVDIEMVDCIEKERLKFRHFVSNITP